MGFSRQEHWSRLPFPPIGDLPDPGIKPTSLMFPALADGFFTTKATRKLMGFSQIFFQVRFFLLFHRFHDWKIWSTRQCSPFIYWTSIQGYYRSGTFCVLEIWWCINTHNTCPGESPSYWVNQILDRTLGELWCMLERGSVGFLNL